MSVWIIIHHYAVIMSLKEVVKNFLLKRTVRKLARIAINAWITLAEKNAKRWKTMEGAVRKML